MTNQSGVRESGETELQIRFCELLCTAIHTTDFPVRIFFTFCLALGAKFNLFQVVIQVQYSFTFFMTHIVEDRFA